MVDEVVVATSTNSADDPLVDYCRQERISVCRGPEKDVLQRFLMAMQETAADVVVRVCGDSPLVDPVTLDRMIYTLIREKGDICRGKSQNPVIHEGFTPLTSNVLRRLDLEAGEDPVAREHVTSASSFWDRKDVKNVFCSIGSEYEFSGAKISIDTPADLRFLEQVYERLAVQPGEADVREVVQLLRVEPWLLEINHRVHQKRPEERNLSVIIRCDGDAQIGFGHAYRCLALAEELREIHAVGSVFAMISGEISAELVRSQGYPVEMMPSNVSEEKWLLEMVHLRRPDVIIFDIRTGLSQEALTSLKNEASRIVVIDDDSDRRLAADIVFYPPVPQALRLSWEKFSGKVYVGWEWVLLRRQFATIPIRESNEIPKILVTMGGSDPAGFTLQALSALSQIPIPFETVVVIGPGFMHRERLTNFLEKNNLAVTVQENVSDMAGLMAQADLAVASFGVTAYELAASGVPAIFLCLTEDHAKSASAFVEAGVAVSLDYHDGKDRSDILTEIEKLGTDRKQLDSMRKRTRLLVDGKGAERVAALIVKSLEV